MDLGVVEVIYIILLQEILKLIVKVFAIKSIKYILINLLQQYINYCILLL